MLSLVGNQKLIMTQSLASEKLTDVKFTDVYILINSRLLQGGGKGNGVVVVGGFRGHTRRR